MKKLILTTGFMVLAFAVLAQAPAAFNYQAIARTSSGDIMAEKELTIRVGILLNDNLVWQEDHVVTTNQQGHFSIKIGGDKAINGTGTAGSFDGIDWGIGSYMVNLKVDDDSDNDFLDLGSNELLSVPYALYAVTAGSDPDPWLVEGNSVSLDPRFNVGVGTNVASGKFVIQGDNQPDDIPLLEIINNKGQPVLSGFNNGTFIHVEPRGKKGLKGGFAVGGYTSTKDDARVQEYLRVTSDSIRLTINDQIQGKGLKGGFAVGGYTSGKAGGDPYFFVNQSFTEINGTLQLNGEFVNLSDASLKRNIMELDHVLDKLQQLRGVSFDWNQLARDTYSVKDKKQIGVLAQELEAIYPELVITNDKGYKMVDYSKLTPVLLQAVKEQQQQIDALQERDKKISELEDRIIQLEQLINQ